MSAGLVWFRRDLRLRDHPALRAALREHDQVVPFFCFDDRLLHGRHASGPRTRFLLECLAELDAGLRQRGSGLVIRRGPPEREVAALALETGASAVHHSADVTPFAGKRDDRAAASLGGLGVELRGHPGLCAVDDVMAVTTKEGRPYTVFTPFWRNWAGTERREVHRAPRGLPALPGGLRTGTLPSVDSLGLRERVATPMPGGEAAGRKRLDAFSTRALGGYREEGNMLGRDGSSRLSAYLHFGCVSPRQVEERLPRASGNEPTGPGAFHRQIAWRDFYHHVLGHFPANARLEFQERYRGTLAWRTDERGFEAWCDGETGFPLVDAGMRQLRQEGWMHNRARLVAASFLTKDLGIDWRRGERWFMRWLLDGDEANNNGNWQWIASVGVDAQPAYRHMYNPARHQERFDPDGAYVRRYVPELERVPARYLAEPWTMPEDVQREAGCRLGTDYPEPIVDRSQARQEALARYRVQ
jgi:deoxyribodipyrimidine photo-lyase